MAEGSSRKQHSKMGEAFARKTHFNPGEIEGLLSIYRRIQRSTKPRDNSNVSSASAAAAEADRLDRGKFREFLHGAFCMTDDILLDRIFKYFDFDNDGYISREEWVMGLSIFLRGNEEEKLKYCFDIYDLNGDGHITREEMLTMLKTSLGRQGLDEDPDEGVKDLIDMTLKKMDKDKDGRVSFKDWTATVKHEPLMMEAFGPCLPTERTSALFFQKVEAEYSECKRL